MSCRNDRCFPHAIGIGATWDRQLIKEISQITAVEARVLEQKYWALHNGTYIGATSFDGGPLANVAYDPRVGRTSEMYGECPYHTGQVGKIATLALQNKTAVEANGDYFLQTSQVSSKSQSFPLMNLPGKCSICNTLSYIPA